MSDSPNLRRYAPSVVLAGLVMLSASCHAPTEPIIRGEGQMQRVESCFRIVTGSQAYQPLVVPPEFRVEGIRVRFEARSQPTFNTCMGGDVVELLSISRLP